MFFVLSGFLITNSLIFSISKNHSLINVYFNFYIRRALRIFPLYYLLLIIFFFIVKDPVLHLNPGYYFFYGVNFLILSIQEWPSHFAHFWSLAVEEQFYAVWPLIILPFFNSRFLIIKILVIFLVCIVYLVLTYDDFNNSFFLVNPLFSSLAILSGALLSWCWNYKRLIKIHRKYVLGLILLPVVILFFKNGYYGNIVFIFGSIIFSVLLIMILITNNEKFEKKSFFWDNDYLIYLGKISYGIYIFHNFVPSLFSAIGINGKEYINGTFEGYVTYYMVFPLAYLAVTVLLSHLSWRYFENPVNQLKRYFP
jgi:peptidoglycan/LPS O-acetylase OafA/YrhL